MTSPFRPQSPPRRDGQLPPVRITAKRPLAARRALDLIFGWRDSDDLSPVTQPSAERRLAAAMPVVVTAPRPSALEQAIAQAQLADQGQTPNEWTPRFSQSVMRELGLEPPAPAETMGVRGIDRMSAPLPESALLNVMQRATRNMPLVGLAQNENVGAMTDQLSRLVGINNESGALGAVGGPAIPSSARAKLANLLGETTVGGRGRGSLTPVPEIRAVLEELRMHLERPRVTHIPLERGRQFARVYSQLPTVDPSAKSAYDLLNEHILRQRERLERAGYKFEFVPDNPYASSAEMVKDVGDNRRLRVLQTPTSDFHPYLTPSQNDSFRGVHDMLAHAGGGNQFGAIGEENAYRAHFATLPQLAQQALATETRGQNSWVNFGPYSHLPASQRPYATQKAALWPKRLLLGALLSAGLKQSAQGSDSTATPRK